MPVESKPLFRPDALRPHLRQFQLPRPGEEYRTILAKWADMLAAGKADRFKEQEILHDFLTDVFCGILGYTRLADDPDPFKNPRTADEWEPYLKEAAQGRGSVRGPLESLRAAVGFRPF